ncbi:MAG: MBL fold metallo-hydrolase [Hymenobacteraceae bacterium]|nr:MBL fold metallo-hydrolase [Hymenobacteraceae bacterium]MDX5396827.1 MBL fold metallo-hydrolase [Hymenobacteraceae bacterium]MDX5442533.1 MBL fold metallo-hydrolase [Hymenobacteraceae bacterium]MDX5512898.1 MBL fold metallo-hydrolase [Hymenobacteraceae bacterium]
MEVLDVYSHPQPDQETGRSFFKVAPGIWGLKTVFVNLYFIESNGNWVLLDTGVYGSTKKIKETAAELFGSGNKPLFILLTHGHFDHVGAVKELAEEWDVPVFAHLLELPYLTGRSSYPPPDPTVGGGGMAFMSFMYPKKPIDLSGSVVPLPEDGSVPGLPEWKWLHTPGHSHGHVSFFRPQDKVLLAGDAFITRDGESAMAVLTQHRELHGPPAYFTSDWQASKQSVQKLAELLPAVVATGHGLPMQGEHMQQQLQELAQYFDQLAVPEKGRYVKEPAIADENGVIYVPPAPENPVPKALATAGLVALAGLAVYAIAKNKKKKRLHLHGPAVMDRSYYHDEGEDHFIDDFNEEHYDDEDIFKDDPYDPLGNPRSMSNNYP